MTGDGWAKGADGIWAKGGKKASFTIITTPGNKRRELTEQIIQPQLKAAGFDMKIKNTSAGDLFGRMLPDGNYQLGAATRRASPRSRRDCARCSARRTSRPTANGNTGNNWSFDERPGSRHAAARSSTTASTTTRGRRPARRPTTSSPTTTVALPLDPLPDILIWSKKVVGPVEDNPIVGMFWNIDQWGVQASSVQREWHEVRS